VCPLQKNDHSGSEDVLPFDIMGICTSRDVFTLADDGKHPVKAYVRLSVPSFIDGIGETEESSKMTMDDVNSSSNYFKRVKLDELNRSYRKRLDSSVSDWVLIDLRTLSYEYFEASYRGGKEYFMNIALDAGITNEEELVGLTERDVILALEKRGLKDITVKKIGFEDIEGLDEAIARTCDYIKGRYGRNVILLEVHESGLVLESPTAVIPTTSKEAERRERLMSKYFPIFESRLGCHVIRNPRFVIRDPLHIWGKNEVHYVQEFYDYAMGCLDVITSCPDEDDERTQLQKLYLDLESKLIRMMEGTYLSRHNTLVRIDRRWKRSNGCTDVGGVIKHCSNILNKTDDPILKREIHRRIGIYNLERTDGKANVDRSIRYLRMSADEGSKEAEDSLLEALWTKDDSVSEALGLARKLKKEERPIAYGILGRAYRDGRGVVKNPKKAKSLLHHAARKGVPWAEKEMNDIII